MLAVMCLSSFAPVAWFAKAYVNVFRSIPLVMVLLWFYLIVPGFLQNVLGLSPKNDIRLISAMVAFSMFEAAYYSEIIPCRYSKYFSWSVERRAGVGNN